jgi:SnoaL-like domain
MGIDETVARDEITQLCYRYAWALDSRDLDVLVECFVSDSTSREFWEESLGGVGVTVLMVTNALIDFEANAPDDARGVVYCNARVEDPPASGRIVEQAIVYFDRYRRGVDGRWRFVGRRHELFWGVEATERPLDQRDANWPESSSGRGTLPYRLETWRRFWSPGT